MRWCLDSCQFEIVKSLSTNMITPIYRKTVPDNFDELQRLCHENKKTKSIFIKLVLVNLINN